MHISPTHPQQLLTSCSRYIIRGANGANTRHPLPPPHTPPASRSRVSCSIPAPRNPSHTINITRMPRTSRNGQSQWLCCLPEKRSRVSYSIFQFLRPELFLRKIRRGDQWSMRSVGICVTLACLKCFCSPHANDFNSNYDLISDGVQTVSL